MKNSLVTVFGGGGFIGRYVVQALMRAGARVRVAERSPKSAWFLKAQANLGQIQFAAADVTDPESVARAVSGAQIVINLVGSFENMEAVQAKGAENVARAAAAAGVAQLVHISAIGADSASPSVYGKSKGNGELAVHAAFPGAIILRPSLVFGAEDQFTNRFAAMIRLFPIVPVMRGAAKFQPVFVGDVARAVVAALQGDHAGKTFELGGPNVMSMMEINRWLGAETGRERGFVDVPDVAGAALARFTGFLPGAPITWDQWLMLQSDNVVAAGADGLSALGIAPAAMALEAPAWLVNYRKYGRFSVKAGA